MKKKDKFKLKGLQCNSIDKRGTMDSMSSAHNIRIDGNEMIRSVCENRIGDFITQDNEYSIRFCHTFIGKENYIAVKNNAVDWVEINEGEILQKANLYGHPEDQMTDITFDFFAFGNTLYITIKKDGEPIDEKPIHWQMTKYIDYDIDSICPPSPRNINCKYMDARQDGAYVPPLVVSAELDTALGAPDDRYVVNKYNYYYKEHIDKFIKLNYIYGTVYLMFAYKLIDGSVIKQSGIHMLDSMPIDAMPGRSIYLHDGGAIVSFHMDMAAIIPTIEFDMPQSIIDNKLIESIMVYSSRNNPYYDYDNIYQKLNFSDPDQKVVTLLGKTYTRISAQSVIDTQFAKVAHLPFYEIAEIDFRERADVVLTFSDHYKNIEQCPIFKPNLSLHKMIGKSMYEYNSRLHLLGVNMEFFKGEIIAPNVHQFTTIDALYTEQYFTSGSVIFKTTLEDNNETLVCYAKKNAAVFYSDKNYSKYIALPNMITYPDVRAKKIEAYYEDVYGDIYLLHEFPLIKAPENGLAYYQDFSTELVTKFLPFIINNEVTLDFTDEHNKTMFHNRIAVSNIDNGYVFEYANVIDINNRNTIINGVETIYQSFTENTFGLYPLYVFTNQGIFALESKDATTIYSNIVPISSQITDEYFHSISASGSVFFITQKGIHSLRDTSCKYISSNIEKHQHAGIDFSDYLQGSTLIYVPYYDEIIINNSLYPYCYLYSIQKDEFTTKDFGYSQISKDKIIKDNGVYSLLYSENISMPLFSYIESNADMFGTMDKKRIRGFEVSGMFKCDARLIILGSNNAIQWNEIKSINACDKRLKKCSGSWRYLKYSLSSSYIELDSVEIDVESRGL